MSTTEYSTRAAQNASLWRERVARHVGSGKTIAAFCREEGIGKSTLSHWRRRLGVAGIVATAPAAGTAFLDLGPVKASPVKAVTTPPSPASLTGPARDGLASLELRLELGHGIVLHIARH
jgi:transposase-like protein